jgi:hypothetical protein
MRDLTPQFFESMPPNRCGSKGCPEPRIEGRYMCAEHAKEMDRIREAFNEEARRKIRRSKRPPTCCVPGCYEPRERNKAFCDAHRDNVEND